MQKYIIALIVIAIVAATAYYAIPAKTNPASVTLNEIWPYGNVDFFRDGDDLYLVWHNSFESEYFGQAYHVDLAEGSAFKIGSMIVQKRDGQIVAAKTYDVDLKVKYDGSGNEIGYEYDRAQLEAASQATSIPTENLQVTGMGGKPWTFVMVKAIYDPQDKTLKPTNVQITPPNLVNPREGLFGEPYPGPEFVNVGYLEGGNMDVVRDGIRFIYTESAKTLRLEY